MRNKSFILYLLGGIALLLIFVYEMSKYGTSIGVTGILLSGIPVVLLLYLAYRVYLSDPDEDEM